MPISPLESISHIARISFASDWYTQHLSAQRYSKAVLRTIIAEAVARRPSMSPEIDPASACHTSKALDPQARSAQRLADLERELLINLGAANTVAAPSSFALLLQKAHQAIAR